MKHQHLLATWIMWALLAGCGSVQSDEGAAVDDATDATGDGLTDTTVTLSPPRTLDFCVGTTHQRYDPLHDAALALFPDDLWSKIDAATPTGRRLDVNASTPWILSLTESFSSAFTDLSRLDGWGTTAALFVRFDGPLGAVPSGAAPSLASAGVQLWQLEPTPRRLPFEATTIDDGDTLVLSPMLPLRPKTQHLLVVTRALAAADGGCLAPAKVTRAMLERTVTQARLRARVAPIEAALALANVAPADVSAVSVFTTQSIVEESVAVAKDIAKRSYTWSQSVTCSSPSNKPYRLCEGRFVGQEYRKGREVVPVGQGPLEHRVRLWLPKTPPQVAPPEISPAAIIVFGHGLTGNKDQGEPVAVFAAPLNVAVVAIDAVHHGQHPAGGAIGLAAVLKFFGVDAATFTFDFLKLRDNWRQSTFDKLQLLRLLAQQPDVDGDGVVDLDPTQIAYIGVSLGGIMGPELLALSDQCGAAVLSVSGGKVSSIIQSSTEFAPLIVAFRPDGTTADDVARFFPILQTLVERGDAANWARHVLTQRLPLAPARVPSVLLQMAINDEIVPNVATRVLARAMAVPQVGPTLQAVGLVPEGVALPVAGNIDGGAATAGLFQFDKIHRVAGGPLLPAHHSSVPASLEALAQDKAFIVAWLTGKAAKIINPL